MKKFVDKVDKSVHNPHIFGTKFVNRYILFPRRREFVDKLRGA